MRFTVSDRLAKLAVITILAVPFGWSQTRLSGNQINDPAKLISYEVGNENSTPLSTADLNRHSITINSATSRNLTEASCISDGDMQTITLTVGTTILFSITCVPPTAYNRTISDGTAGYIVANSMNFTTIGPGAQIDMSGIANDVTKNIKLSAWAQSGATVRAPSPGSTLRVCNSGCTYNTVQSAFDASYPGDTIVLKSDEDHGPLTGVFYWRSWSWE